ncbi:hypothetical protein VNO80_15405 [Phaseolus coccineus]|uniref:Uncharacterized protein n=1 Tax=Phaseolus coccineus TaxID=3886 RepID=A0AAN9MNN6_PHACN
MDSKEKFHTMNLLNKDHGLVDQAFAIQFGNELSPNWFLVDDDNNRYIVKYNMDMYRPELTRGWSEIHKYYELHGNDVCIGEIVNFLSRVRNQRRRLQGSVVAIQSGGSKKIALISPVVFVGAVEK